MNTCCATGSLNVYVPNANAPWNEARIKHLYNRIGFGANQQEISQALSISPAVLVDQIIDLAVNSPLPPVPDWVYWDNDQFLIANQCYDNGQLTYNTRDVFVTGEWLRSIAEEPNRFRFKMALFWHNHFVTEQNKYGHVIYMYQYYHKLLQYGLGNFKDFTRAMVTDKAMLYYLDGKDNKVCSPTDTPNENFARELYELFTIGPGNYTDDGTPNDVHETARALSGWKIERLQVANGWTADDLQAPVYLDTNCHDSDMKTIFGTTANFDTDSLIDHLFQQKSNEIADFICRKIYKEFIHSEEVDDTVIDGMKTTFLNNNFEIEPVVRQLLKSEHFFDTCFIGSKIKSPAEYFVGFFNDIGIQLTDSPLYAGSSQIQNSEPLVTTGFTGGVNLGIDEPIDCAVPHMLQPYTNNLLSTWVGWLSWTLRDNGQNLFNPPNVGGWVGHHTWLSSSQLLFRWERVSFWLNSRLTAQQQTNLVTFMQNLCNNSIDNYEIATIALNHFIQRAEPFQYDRTQEQNPDNNNDMEVKTAATVFAGSFPQEEFDLGFWSWSYFDAFNQVKQMVVHILGLPAYQLH